VVYFHTGTLAATHKFTLARAGYRYTMIAEQSRPNAIERAIAQRALAHAFPAADPESITVLLDGSTVMSVNTGHIVLREGASERDLYIAVSGELTVVHERDGKVVELGRVDAGEV